jgi:hypothetical protein
VGNRFSYRVISALSLMRSGNASEDQASRCDLLVNSANAARATRAVAATARVLTLPGGAEQTVFARMP